MQPQHVLLETSGMYATASGSLVSVLRVSPAQSFYLGNNHLVYSASGQVIRPQKRYKLGPHDLIRDVASLAPDDGSLDLQWSMCRTRFLQTDGYHQLVALAEVSCLGEHEIALEADRFLALHPHLSRFRGCLIIMTTHLLEIHRHA